MPYLILGCGYTGQRVAAHLLERGERVLATTRQPKSLTHLPNLQILPLDLPGGTLPPLPHDTRVLHSIPALNIHGNLTDPTPELIPQLRSARRIVYLSTTGVYGSATDVNEHTPPNATTPRELVRLQAETAIVDSGIPYCILRPAAIYGPDRGIHIAMLEGTATLTGDGSSYTSRIHVDDLAAITLAALDSDIQGAWPVADELPSTQREIAEFCAALFHLPMPASVDPQSAPPTRRANRRVDGSAIRRLLQIQLRYPTYREGLRAAKMRS